MLAVVLGEQREALVVPHHPCVALLESRQLHGVTGERGREAHDAVLMGDLRPRVSAVQRLRPHQGGGRCRLPGDGPWAGAHASEWDILGERQRGERASDLALQVPDLELLGEAVGRNEIGVRPECLHDQQEFAPRRGVDTVEHRWRTDRRPRAGRHIHQRELGGEVVVEQRFIAGVRQ